MSGLVLGLALSAHLSIDGDYNRYHPYVQYTHDDYTIGMTYNSEERISVYGLKTFTKDKLFLDVGVATGYPAFEDKLSTPVSPVIRVGYHISDSISIFMMPGGVVDENNNFDSGLVIGTQKRF